MLLVESQTADPAGFTFEPIEIGHVGGPGHAGNPGERRGRAEDDVAIGQVTGVVVVHIRLMDQRELLEVSTVGIHLEDLPAAIVAGHREEQPARVEIQIHIPDKTPALGSEQGVQPAIRPDG